MTEPDNAAGSAVRALGYLTWGLAVGTGLDGGLEEAGGDRELQDRAVLALAKRLELPAGGGAVPPTGARTTGRGGAREERGVAGGRRADVAAAKCR